MGKHVNDYSVPSGIVTGTHNISLDPLFIDTTNDDYHLQKNSPCIDAGDPAGVPLASSNDIDGNRRPMGGLVDIGAYEHFLGETYLPLVVRNHLP